VFGRETRRIREKSRAPEGDKKSKNGRGDAGNRKKGSALVGARSGQCAQT
jgi:hypothetical protein